MRKTIAHQIIEEALASGESVHFEFSGDSHRGSCNGKSWKRVNAKRLLAALSAAGFEIKKHTTTEPSTDRRRGFSVTSGYAVKI